jgi:hypothetical protein
VICLVVVTTERERQLVWEAEVDRPAVGIDSSFAELGSCRPHDAHAIDVTI